VQARFARNLLVLLVTVAWALFAGGCAPSSAIDTTYTQCAPADDGTTNFICTAVPDTTFTCPQCTDYEDGTTACICTSVTGTTYTCTQCTKDQDGTLTNCECNPQSGPSPFGELLASIANEYVRSVISDWLNISTGFSFTGL